MTTVGANGNCSEDPDALEEAQTEAVDMVVDRQPSPGAVTCDDARPGSEHEHVANGNQVAAEGEHRRQEGREDERRKVSRELSRECEDGVGKDSYDRDTEMLESLRPRIDAVKQTLVQDTKGFGVFRLEMLHASICRVLRQSHDESCTSRLASLEAFIADEAHLI